MLQQIAAASHEAHKARQDRSRNASLLTQLNELMQSVPSSPMEDQRVKDLLKAETELQSQQTRIAKANDVALADMIVSRDAAREEYMQLSSRVIQWSKSHHEWDALLRKCGTDLQSLREAWGKYGQGMVGIC